MQGRPPLDTSSPKRAAQQRGRIPRRAPGRPAQTEVAGLRELYLQTALDTFLAHGYAGASMEQIARAAGAGKVTFYRQFGSKAQLFRVVALHAIAKVRRKLNEPSLLDGTPEHVLRELVGRLHDGLTDPEYLAVLKLVIAETGRFPELGEALLSHDQYTFEPVVAFLARASAEGTLAVPDPYAGAMQLAALASGGGRFLIKPPKTDRRSRSRWIEAVLRFVMAAWQVAPSAVRERRRQRL